MFNASVFPYRLMLLLVLAIWLLSGCDHDDDPAPPPPVNTSSVKITANPGVCTPRTGGAHATTMMFFGSDIKNIIATTNELQKQAGAAVSQDTDVTFDVWQSNGENAGSCIGSVDVHIDGGTNERAEVVFEDLLTTPVSGQGVLIRTGQLDVRKKFDSYVQVTDPGTGERQIIWNNFTGMPNASRLMSTMRFVSGQRLAIYYTGLAGTQAEANIQIFKNDGSFVGVATQTIGVHSVVVTDDVRSLVYKDLTGAVVAPASLPADGEGYLKVAGLNALETEASCMVVYSEATPDVSDGAWDNRKLATATFTFARRNGGNDPLGLGE